MYLNHWEDGGIDSMAADFDLKPSDLAGVEVLFASYETPSYEGYAFVLFRRDGKLWEVNGSHCSCYGLEGQWDPEETDVKALLHRVESGGLGDGTYDENPFAKHLKAVLSVIAGPAQPQ